MIRLRHVLMTCLLTGCSDPPVDSSDTRAAETVDTTAGDTAETETTDASAEQDATLPRVDPACAAEAREFDTSLTFNRAVRGPGSTLYLRGDDHYVMHHDLEKGTIIGSEVWDPRILPVNLEGATAAFYYTSNVPFVSVQRPGSFRGWDRANHHPVSLEGLDVDAPSWLMVTECAYWVGTQDASWLQRPRP